METERKSNILLINTSSKKIEFAYNKKGDFCILKELNEGKNADDLVYEIKSDFDEHTLCFQDIDYVGLLNGPGSYTGLRIGSSIAKAVCFATGADLAEVNSLDLIALKFYERYPDEVKKVIPLVFSNMKTGEFYYTVYKDGKRISDYGIEKAEEIEKFNGIFVTNEKTKYGFTESVETLDFSDTSDIHILLKITEEYIAEKRLSDFRTSEPFYMKQFFGD